MNILNHEIDPNKIVCGHLYQPWMGSRLNHEAWIFEDCMESQTRKVFVIRHSSTAAGNAPRTGSPDEISIHILTHYDEENRKWGDTEMITHTKVAFAESKAIYKAAAAFILTNLEQYNNNSPHYYRRRLRDHLKQ